MTNPKKKLASKMMTPLERKHHISPFDSDAWLNRKLNRKRKDYIKVETSKANKRLRDKKRIHTKSHA